MIQFKQYFVPVQIQETTFCREGTRTMDARRAQDILRHIINDEDYGAAMLDKISVTESIEVLTKMLPDCVATAQNDNNINDAGFFSQMIHNYYPLILDKIKNAEHLWVVYSDNTGYPYMIDGDLFVLYDYANHAELEKKLNTAGYQVALESVTPTDFRNEVAHMYRNGYEKIRFTDGKGEPFVVAKEDLYSFEDFFNEEYMTNPGLQRAMIEFFQEFRKNTAAEGFLHFPDGVNDIHSSLLVQPSVLCRQAHAAQQNAVQCPGIGGDLSETAVLEQCLGNAEIGEQLARLTVEVVVAHSINESSSHGLRHLSYTWLLRCRPSPGTVHRPVQDISAPVFHPTAAGTHVQFCRAHRQPAGSEVFSSVPSI